MCACRGWTDSETARHLNVLEEPPAVIFTTAYDQYAVEAFDAHAVGYLLKPVRKEQLAPPSTRAGRLTRAQLQTLAAAEQGQRRTHIAARNREGLKLIPLEEVQYFLADQKYTTVRHLRGEELIEDSLRLLEERVRPGLRAHPPQRADRGEVSRAHRAQCRGTVLRAPARLPGTAAGQPPHGRGAQGALPDLTRALARPGVARR